MNVQPGNRWQFPRFISFWVGAALTTIFSGILFVAVSIDNGGFPNWYALITIAGAPFAYWVAWVSSDRPLIRVVAVVLYIAAIVPALYSPTIVFFYFLGLLGIAIGTPDRGAAQKPLP